ncbi:hypothetical protein SLE2022_130650 [Rubroshorea leprosula]
MAILGLLSLSGFERNEWQMGNNPVTVMNPRSVTSTFGLQICILSSILRVLKVHIGDLELDGNGKGSADTLEACESLLGALLKVYMSPMIKIALIWMLL